MLKPKVKWQKFKSEEDKLEKLKELKIVSPKAEKVKEFFYKGFYVNKPTKCEVIGFVDYSEIVLKIEGQFHSIHPDYFIDMQKKDFSLK